MKVQLKTGTLELTKNNLLDQLIGFSSRINKKRAFLFVSKVLGKHIPCKPSSMTNIHFELANLLKNKLNDKPSVVIGFAETATGIGNGVFEQLQKPNSFYIHTTRYKLSYPVLVEFQEEHCHAPSHIIYDFKDNNLKDIIKNAENIILVDDEITTGNTLKNIVKVLREKFPQIKNYYAVSIINWMKEFPKDINFIYLYNDTFNFISNNFNIESNPVSITSNENNLDKIIPYNFGRFGIKNNNIDYSKYVEISELKNKKVIVIGTGEFMHQSYLLGKYLEDNGIDVYVQSTTRSPVNVDYDIKSKLEFKDNYFENIDNFLYNVSDKYYDIAFICYETISVPKEHKLKSILEKHISEVKELFIKEENI